MHSLFRANGGRKKTIATPSEKEGLALAVAAAMKWSLLRDASNTHFFTNIADTCKRLDCTERRWTHAEMTSFVHNDVFNGIPQYAVQRWLEQKFLSLKGVAITEERIEVIQSVIYRYLSSVDAGVDYESALRLCIKVGLDDVLKEPDLGGKAGWNTALFLDEEVSTHTLSCPCRPAAAPPPPPTPPPPPPCG